MNKLQLGNLCLLEQPIPRPESTAPQPENLNHIWIFDRSGALSGLIDDLIKRLPTLNIGDTLTLGWFSGEGQRNFIAKGYKITGPKDAAILGKMLQANSTTIGTTCFSEILADTDQVVQDLRAIMPDFALCFLTDGYPVVNNYTQEVENINKTIDKVQGSLASVLLVGYGSYYNKELMGQMTARFGGSLVHAANLAEFSTSLTEFTAASREYGVKASVEPAVYSPYSVYFSLNGKTITVYQTDSNGAVMFAPSRKGRNSLFILTDGKLADGTPWPKGLEDPGAIRAAYAAAHILTQTCRTHLALEVLGALGDVALIDAANNSWTNDEYGRTESQIKQALGSPKARFLKGRDTNHLPKADAFCFLDAIELLKADDSARFFPYHPDFKYDRIGVKSKPKDGMPKFEPEANPSVELDALTWNDTMLNLSLTFRVPGTVNLDADAAKFNFTEKYRTNIWRSFSFVKDGNVNIKVAPFMMSPSVFSTLLDQGLIDVEGPGSAAAATKWPVMVHFDRIPVMNRAIADGKTSAKALCTKAIQELRLEAQVKVLKATKVKLEAAGAKNLAQATPLTPAQEAYLAKFYIGKNGFQVPSEEADSTDFYTAKEFAIKIKGCSTLPSVSAVTEKLAKIAAQPIGSKKSLTLSEGLISAAMDYAQSFTGAPSAILTRVAGELAAKVSELRALRKQIQATKFAILLGKRWFDEFKDRSVEPTLEVDGFTCSLSLREVKVLV